MQDRVYYEDESPRVTAAEIRTKQLTIRTNAVTSVSTASVHPGKWLPLLVLIPILPLYFILLPLVRMLGHPSMAFLTPMLIHWL